MFYKRLCDQWENEADDAIAELEREKRFFASEASAASMFPTVRAGAM
jgi:type I restriction enzyme M protein